jgi:hypothetical protein
MIVYKNLRLAFLFEVAVGIIVMLAVLLVSPKLVLLLAVIAFRPMILKTQTVEDDAPIWRTYYYVVKFSLIFTAITLILLYVFSEYVFIGAVLHDQHGSVLLIGLLPYFIFIHGLVGMFHIHQKGTD